MDDPAIPKPEPNAGLEAPPSGGAELDWQPTPSAPTTPGQTSHMGHNSALPTPSGDWVAPPLALPQKAAPTQDNPSADQTDREPKKELNVRDALGYLDAVKVTFQDNPDVYNHFLDIMKDFKSQVIDTPGVIERVSNLFNGHPSLIQGFNTFLPPGYRIECSMDPHDHNITVTTPTGTTTQTTTGQRNGALANAPASSSQQSFGGDRQHTQGSGVSSPAPGQQGQFTAPPMQGLSAPNGTNYGSPGLAAPRPVTPLVAPFQPMSPGLPGSANAASVLGGMQRGGDPGSTDGNTAEFNRAIQYVNKIKTRFSHDPDTYKQFLEILHIFQKDQREYRDVHSQVQHLFKTAPDLLDEFKQFLPAIGGGGQAGSGLFGMMAAAGNQDGWLQSGVDKPDKLDKTSRKKDAPPPAPPAAPPKRKKRVLDKEAAAAKPGASKKPKHHHSKEPGSPQFGSYHNPGSPGHHHSSLPQPFIPSSNVMNNPDDQAFFDRVKKSFEHRETYDEFLKLLNLFAHDVIDTKTLVDKATPFLGEGTELLMHFRSILDWDDRLDRQDLDMPPTTMVRSSVATTRAPKADMSSRNGPSYRRLPASEAHVACSGRDEMCKSVLNDEWVSHPTWASEESGFVAHKKNQYEDALHKSEEERHEYDFHIEAIVRTISILEPINAKILQMSAEDRALFKLKPGLGGQSKSIHQRIIKKVYGRDAGLEVIQALHDCPAVAVPVVLSRLKQKEEEWKRAQREWNKVWREVDARNFFKALDHQGVMFKANDKKAITSKALVAAIETRREESIQKRSSLVDPLAHRTKAKHHMEFVIDDVGVLQDVLKLVFSFLDRTQGQISYSERQKIEKFLRSFAPLFFLFDPVQFDRTFSTPGPTGAHAVDGSTTSRSVPGSETGSVADENEDMNGPRSSKRNGNANGVQAGDLRKRLLKSTQEGKANSKAPPSRASPGPEPMQIDDPAEDNVGAGAEASAMSVNNIWVHHEGTSDTSNAQPRKSVRKAMFYANTTFYALLRLLEILYSRLLMCKKIASELAAHQDGSYLVNPIAVELGLHDTQGPGGTLAVEGSRNPAVHFYDHMLDCCEKLFDNEMDQSSYEENMRYMFGSKAYKMFTYDKVVGALIKQVQTILGDNRCQDLLSQLQREREVEAPTAQQWINYRRQAENIIGPDEHMFRFNWDKHSMTVQLLSKDDPSLEDVETMTERWKQYISSYVLTHQTEGIPRVRPPFLKRTVFDNDDSVIARPGLEIKVCVRTYRLFFVAHSEDFMWRPALGVAGDLEKQRAARFAEWTSRNEPR